MITFVPLDESHVSLMHSWLSAGEALRWYARQLTTEESIRQKYLITKLRTGTRCFIVQYDQEPIGYLQYYRISDYPRYCSLVGAGPHDYGLSAYEIPCLKRGRFPASWEPCRMNCFVAAALKELIFAQANAERCLVGPSPENQRAIRCFEKCGFRHVRTVVANDGEEEHIMAAEKPNQTLPPPS